MTSPARDMADRGGAVVYLPDPPPPPTPMVLESLRQLLADLERGLPNDEAAARVRSIIYLATCNRGMRVLQDVARKYRVHPRDIRSTNRTRQVTAARHEAAYRLVNEIGWSTLRTGEFLGRDHSTIIAALSAHEERMARE